MEVLYGPVQVSLDPFLDWRDHMPILFSFDIKGAPPGERNRLQSFFERLGWENVGGSSYRYPPLGTQPQTEDWFNCVIPALMLFRAFILRSGRRLTKFSLDTQSSTGYNRASKYGRRPRAGAKMSFESTSQPAFGARNLREWLEQVTWPY